MGTRHGAPAGLMVWGDGQGEAHPGETTGQEQGSWRAGGRAGPPGASRQQGGGEGMGGRGEVSWPVAGGGAGLRPPSWGRGRPPGSEQGRDTIRLRCRFLTVVGRVRRRGPTVSGSVEGPEAHVRSGPGACAGPMLAADGGAERGLGRRRGPEWRALTAQSCPSPFNGPLSPAIEHGVRAPWRRPAAAISGEAGMRRAGPGWGWGRPFSRPGRSG